MKYEELELFIIKIGSQLRVMRIIASHDPTYLDANRWERLISHHIPHLHKFHFRHHQYSSRRFVATDYDTLIQRFTSSFWIERQWIFQLQINKDLKNVNEIIYSIRPQK